MRWFFDTEFIDTGHSIALISIGLVSEDKKHARLICLADGWREEDCGPWLKENVLPKLPLERVSRKQAATEIVNMVGPKPEFWGYFVAYDWVALCQLVASDGRMVTLPGGFHSWPHLAFDLKQLMFLYGFKKEDLPAQDKETEHDALADAEWVRDSFLFVRQKLNHQLDSVGRNDGMGILIGPASNSY